MKNKKELAQRKEKKDLDFIGYTYKNFEVVGEEVRKAKPKPEHGVHLPEARSTPGRARGTRGRASARAKAPARRAPARGR